MNYLEALRLALEYEGLEKVRIYRSPDEDDVAITLIPYDGEPIAADQNVVGEYQSVQIVARGTTENPAISADLSRRAYRAVLRYIDEQRDFGGYRVFEAIQAPTYMQRDEKLRHYHVFNIRLSGGI